MRTFSVWGIKRSAAVMGREPGAPLQDPRVWFVVCGGRFSILHYGILIENKQSLYPDAKWESPSASLNKCRPPFIGVTNIHIK